MWPYATGQGIAMIVNVEMAQLMTEGKSRARMFGEFYPIQITVNMKVAVKTLEQAVERITILTIVVRYADLICDLFRLYAIAWKKRFGDASFR